MYGRVWSVWLLQQQKTKLQTAITMAKFFLENNLNTIAPDDYLSVALTCLALTKAGSPAADTLFNTMMSKSTTERKSRDCQYCQNYTFYNVETKTGKILGWTWSYNDRS